MTNWLKWIAFTKDLWSSAVFSDEGKFCIFGKKGRKLAWKNFAQKEHLVPTVEHDGGGVMVWGCMSSNDVGKLEYIESIMNKYDYFDVLRNNLKERATKLGLK
ncbi:transposable element Tc1 transposase [Trichonephila clavipes]|nr:transposable element Tc1 transposase [Trichonephila clavipes]